MALQDRYVVRKNGVALDHTSKNPQDAEVVRQRYRDAYPTEKADIEIVKEKYDPETGGNK